MPHAHVPAEADFNEFEGLVIALKNALGSSGLTCADIDTEHLTDLMQSYQSNEEEWGRFALRDPSKGYTRNLIDTGNGKSNLLILVWTPGKGSPIHTHSNSHCLVKMLQGELTETLYNFPTDGELKGDEADIEVISESTYTENQVTYINDDLGVHKMWNKGKDYAISLHLYTPPNIATEGCYVFDVLAGAWARSTQFDYHSVRGNVMKGVVGGNASGVVPAAL